MKKVFVAIALLIIISSCESQSQKDLRLKRIEALIEARAMGNDIGYEVGKLDTEIVVTVEKALKNIETELNAPIEKIIPHFTKVYQNAQKDNDAAVYRVWKHEVERMLRLQKMKLDEVDFSVYKYKYTISSIPNPKARISVTNYYFFNHKDSLVGFLDERDMRKLKMNNIQSETQPYTMAMISLETLGY